MNSNEIINVTHQLIIHLFEKLIFLSKIKYSARYVRETNRVKRVWSDQSDSYSDFGNMSCVILFIVLFELCRYWSI